MPEESNQEDQQSQPPTGRNFAAGMTGGIGYVVDKNEHLPRDYNPGSVELESVDEGDEANALRDLIEQHRKSTGSETAADWLKNYPDSLDETTKIMSTDYKKMLGDQ